MEKSETIEELFEASSEINTSESESRRLRQLKTSSKINGNGNLSSRKIREVILEDSDALMLEEIDRVKLLDREDVEEFLIRHHASRVNFLKTLGLSEDEAIKWADGSIKVMREIG